MKQAWCSVCVVALGGVVVRLVGLWSSQARASSGEERAVKHVRVGTL